LKLSRRKSASPKNKIKLKLKVHSIHKYSLFNVERLGNEGEQFDEPGKVFYEQQ
jgi:hypothetical protein